ncbi:MAG: hypothetical protein WC661_08710 [Opitutaceae bacterium]
MKLTKAIGQAILILSFFVGLAVLASTINHNSGNTAPQSTGGSTERH